LKANIFYLDIGGTSNYFRGYYKAIFYARNMAKQIKKVVPIDKIDISEFLSLGLGIPIGDWNNVSKLLQEQLDFLNRNKSETPFTFSVAQFLKKNEQLEDKLRDWDRKIFSAKLNHR